MNRTYLAANLSDGLTPGVTDNGELSGLLNTGFTVPPVVCEGRADSEHETNSHAENNGDHRAVSLNHSQALPIASGQFIAVYTSEPGV